MTVFLMRLDVKANLFMIGLAKCSFILYGFHGFINPHFIPCKCPLIFTMKLINMTYLMLSRKNIVSHCLGFPGVYSFFFILTRLLLLIFSPSLLKKIYHLKLLICHMWIDLLNYVDAAST